MAASFPVTFPSALSITGTQTLQDVGHTDNLHVKDRDEIIASQTKLGLGSSVASGTTALLGTGGTQSAWGQITNAYVAGTAAIALSKLENGTKGYAVLAGASGATYGTVARKNRVINGDMRVAQRPTLGSTDNSYTLDRWRVLMESASSVVVTQETSDVPTNGSNRAMKLTVGGTANKKFAAFTPLEFLDSSDLRGKTVSVQFKMKATSGIADVRAAIIEWTSTADSISVTPISSWNGGTSTNPTLIANWGFCTGYTSVNLSPTTSWATYRIEGVTVGASTNNIGVLIWNNDSSTTTTSDYLLITDVDLEEGAICTDVERRSYAHELMLCQRYYRKLQATGQYSPFGNGNLSSTTTLDTVVTFGTMRTAPTATYGPAASDFTILINGGAFAASAIATVPGTNTTADVISVRSTITAQPAAGASGTLTATSSAACILLSSEL